MKRFFKTATDVLRFIAEISGEDISLSSPVKCRRLSRKERRFIMGILENAGNIEEDMLRYRSNWIRIGEILHLGEFDRKYYGKTMAAFNKLRNNTVIDTFNKKVSYALSQCDYKKALEYLSKRPGELARRLDHLLRESEDKKAVINAFQKTAHQVSTPVLLQIREHFLQRDNANKSRVFFPKGQIAKVYCIENDVKQIDKYYCVSVVKICENALIHAFSQKDFLGNVYLSEDLKDYTVPFSQRSTNKAFRAPSRGSRMKLPDHAKAVRAFIWWTNQSEDDYDDRVDIDLSAAVFNEACEYIDHVSYTRLRSGRIQGYHSGDITNGGDPDDDGVSEFLDVDIDAVVKSGGRYIVYQVYSYTGQPFSELTHSMFGWMMREDVNSGEIYEAKTVQQKMDLSVNSTNCVPVIFDCVTREFIWCDMTASIDRHTTVSGGNVENHLTGVSVIAYSLTHMKKPNIYDLIKLHIQARGIRVDKKEDADIVFDIEDGITPFDVDVIVGEYM